MKKILFRFQIILLSILIVLLSFTMPIFASAEKNNAVDDEFKVETEYSKYLKESGYSLATDSISCSGDKYFSENASAASSSTVEGVENVLVWKSMQGSVTYRFDVPKNGLYNIRLSYLPIQYNGMNIGYSLKVDGKHPFSFADKLELNRVWINDGKPGVDGLDNQFAPKQIESKEFTEKNIYDPNGIETEDLQFALSSGIHDITIENPTQPFAIKSIALTAPENTKSYAEVLKEYETKGYKNYSGEIIPIEGEDAVYKSTRSLIPKSDSGSVDVSPNSAVKSVLNFIGGSTWKSPCEEMTWEIDVKNSGLYKIGMNYKQATVINGVSYRHLKIDGITPFKEAKALDFQYGTGWQYKVLGNSEPYLFYLTAGKHTLSMSVTLAETAEYYKELNTLVGNLGEFYLEVLRITGSSPDANRDYDLFRQIPDFTKRLESFSKTMQNLATAMSKTSGKRGSQFIAAINNTDRVVKSMLENPYTAQNYIKDYYNQYLTLGSWLYEMTSMPLSLDAIYLSKPDADEKPNDKGFFDSLFFGIKRFTVSFSSSYNIVDTQADNEETLKIWINWGRDQATVLNSLIQESFTPQKHINVKLEITTASLINGMLAGIQPDLSLHLARTEPVNLAMRGALYDLTNFEDYNDVLSRFGESASMPYKYKDGVYALPDTQSFYIMFYRKDILESLNLEVPKTWDEFIQATAVIQRNNLKVFLPYTQITAATTVNTGVGGLNLFGSILQQFDGSFYNNAHNKCELKTANAFKAFDFWTDFYKKYRIEPVANFYNRFRSGEVPLGIEGYTQYTQLTEAAPEIAGKWGIALVPGMVKEDGTVDHTVSGSGSGCAILSKTKNKEAAWEFLKWWTSPETQLSYNNNVESILGAIARTTTATEAAFEQMSWENDDLKILMEQRSWIKEIPEVPGSYFLSRSVDQAFWAVYNKDENPKDAISEWADLANTEISRKIKEYSK